MMSNRLVRVFAWAALSFVALATLSPIGLRPHLPLAVNLERALAFVVVGILFALAYQRAIWFAVLVMLLGVFGLELLQELRPDRHGQWPDALAKGAGAAIGLGMGWLVSRAGRHSR